MPKRREQIYKFVEKEFIGPDPINWEGRIQENGEEILTGVPPNKRYSAGILYPQKVGLETEFGEEVDADLMMEIINESMIGSDEDEDEIENPILHNHESTNYEYLEDAEELINLSNSFKQSAISLTVSVKKNDKIKLKVKAAIYEKQKMEDAKTGKSSIIFLRKPIHWSSETYVNLPNLEKGIEEIAILNTKLKISITYRYSYMDVSLFTFTLQNTVRSKKESDDFDDCYFQVELCLESVEGFSEFLGNENNFKSDDEDFLSNNLLYRDVRNYATGHGCAADWEESGGKVKKIWTTIFPRFEIKPIVPNKIKNVVLDMHKLGVEGNLTRSLEILNSLCDGYENWIDDRKKEILNLSTEFQITADRHMENCKVCLKRMKKGIHLIENDKEVRKAFELMNYVMLLQQLHSNLPTRKWTFIGEEIHLTTQIPMPVVHDKNTWFDYENKVYGQWRPFQLAFILMNLESMSEKHSSEREVVDLIWFPTGGGKTEAYLGLAAFTIFYRRLVNGDDYGTSVIMRYTLRLLTAQQYHRAASMICACETLRKENEELLGEKRISIGLWVGGETTPNKTSKAVRVLRDLNAGNSSYNPFVILSCPWCGAEMGIVEQKNNENRRVVGYKEITLRNNKKRIIFLCENKECNFSDVDTSLPLFIIDEDIYSETPTLLLGTVDKFATLPFRPEAQSIFGIRDGVKISSPDLIIQDELHLISGPLGSMVGHYETMILNLCSTSDDKGRDFPPKIVASTATISKAKEQCLGLYGTTEENVFIFPPQGLNYNDSFFAIEDKSAAGREYVGLLIPGVQSASASVYLFASLLYAAAEMKVEHESQRDPYWTNVGYFNSIRELGHAATWVSDDIKGHLLNIYIRNRVDPKIKDKKYREKRREIRRSEELTSRIRGDKVTESLKKLETSFNEDYTKNEAIDICLATNMISVGLDVQRLGLMTVTGQPLTTSEYIQATSRVGRDSRNAPGIIFVLYKPGRPRDKSHYENFNSYHSKIYSYVEPTSVTSFSSPVRRRALHAIFIGLLRLTGDRKFNANPPQLPNDEKIEEVKNVILNKVLRSWRRR